MIKGEALIKFRLALYAEHNCKHVEPSRPMTCDTCEDNETCPSAFDCYNTDGDCLEEK